MVVSLELATNMDQTRQRTTGSSLLSLHRDRSGKPVAEDNGIGSAKGFPTRDLHSIRERIALLGGRAGDQSSTQADPDREIRIPYQERK